MDHLPQQQQEVMGILELKYAIELVEHDYYMGLPCLKLGSGVSPLVTRATHLSVRYCGACDKSERFGAGRHRAQIDSHCIYV
jgi:hypothetical protein